MSELTLPHNDDYEREYLAEMVFTRDADRYAAYSSATEDYLFFRKNNQKIAQWSKKLAAEGALPPQVIYGEGDTSWGVLSSAIKARDVKFFEGGGGASLAKLWDYFTPNSNYEWLLEQLISLSVARERTSIMYTEISSREGQLSAEDEEELQKQTDEKIRVLTMERFSKAAIHKGIKDGMVELITDKDQRRHALGVDLGIATIDSAMGGTMKGELVCIAARAGVGKTTLAINIIHEQMEQIRHHRPQDWCLMFSMDMASKAITEKLLMRACGRSWDDINPEHEDVLDKMNQYCNFRTYENPALSVPEIISHTLAAQATMGNRPPAMIVIDHHGKLTSASTRRDLTPYVVASETARDIKVAAKTLQTVIVMLVQLSRKAGDGGTRPSSDMLRDSGVIEEEGDLVVGAWRPDIGQGASDNKLMLAVLKSRRMDCCDIECSWEPRFATIQEMARNVPEEFE